MSPLQEQDEDLANPYPVCCQVAFPRAGIDEYRLQNVHQEIGYFGEVRYIFEMEMRR
jgi:hypothetical protein